MQYGIGNIANAIRNINHPSAMVYRRRPKINDIARERESI